jgi:sterol desaturase/sphingolipid hydroxylase (fatty acid hydroxylase superfamily)
MEQAVLLSIPALLLLMVAERTWGRRRGHDNYRLNDALASLSQGVLSQVAYACTPLLQLGLYTMAYRHAALVHAESWWRTWGGIALAIVLFDFCEYWLHRVGHERSVFWAAHVVHHQSEQLNLTTALRQESLTALLGWVFYVPMALIGVPPEAFLIAFFAVNYYQIWVHTEHVGRLGWLDRVFTTPSNHRVHHAVNDCYIDRNYGGLLVLWDRLFGTYAAEIEPCVYGTRTPLASFHPLRGLLQVYAGLARDAWYTRRWRDKLWVWCARTGWRPADVAARFPQPPFVLARVPHDPPLGRAAAGAAVALFVVAAAAAGAFLWVADDLGDLERAAAAGGLVVVLSLVGTILDGRRLTRAGAALSQASPRPPHPR